ncbi:acyl-CoA thioesterase [Celeribacter indicus]|uniref:4-hydroxylbenzoyl-CoA Thioesterase n=1 Tax=Celeribacter indicus TaxID=1208324 RepID=A0A0B5DXA9_9RHOB|nr:acyl-CoA thioesterase [Celeribacter indicus]AJE44897.1 4-hydroxylbenzoyl-CoA Thioesterase [Celeribacter indicus]SDW97769.1 4-hydroxybenzoyl-CoA thioesterase [Celeribacter indicus]
MPSVLTVDVTFGDCDPAGIVFYPNIFRWMDAAFQKLLRPLGGHDAVCAEFGTIGLGLADAQAQFRSTIRDGDLLEIHTSYANWSRRSVTLAYEGRVDGRIAFEGREVRCLFIRGETGIVAGDIGALRSRLEKTT